MTSPLFCNCMAQQRELDPVGHAGVFTDAVAVEVPLPWRRDMFQQPGALPEPIMDLLALWLRRYTEGQGYPHLPLIIAPDPIYSQDGYRRVMLYTRPAGLFSRFDKVEYLVPVDELGALVWALYEDRAALPRFEAYRVPDAGHRRDILVCTHGTVDAACGRFGYPLYKSMRDTLAGARLRVWRVSHFGGHVFAPTLMDMPTGHFWAYVAPEQAAQIVRREGDVAALRGHYRGWAGLDSGFLQAAECALWQQHGWPWFDTPKSGVILAQDSADPPAWADVQICYRVPGEEVEARALMRVKIGHHVHTEPATSGGDMYAYPQYRVSEQVPDLLPDLLRGR